MIEIQPIERVNMTQRIDNVRRRIAEIETKIGISGDFQTKLEREIAGQAAMHSVTPTQSVAETQKSKPIQSVNDAGKVTLYPANSPAQQTPSVPGEEALPGKFQPRPTQPAPQSPHKEIPDVEPTVPERDDKIFFDNYNGADAEVTPVEDMIMQTAYEYGVDPKLVRAIAIAESDMNQEEISPVGAIGVMQLMPETAQSLGVNPYDTGENIVGGTRYIRQMLDTFDGDVPKAVAAYNAGPGAVKRYGGIPPYAETQNYVGRVMDLFQ